MLSATSYTISEIQKSTEVPLLEWKFQIENGNTGEITISDPLLETEALAQERAISEFLDKSYKIKQVSFTTYRTDLHIGDIINVRGLPYRIKSVTTSINKVTMKATIKAIRYE